MSRGFQKVILLGNLGADPEMKHVNDDLRVATLRVAVGSKRKDRSTGDYVEDTEWFNVTVWNALADIASQYLTKGRQVLIEGRLKTHSWEDKDTGEKKYRTEVVGENLTLVGSGDNQRQPVAAGVGEFDAGDVPF